MAMTVSSCTTHSLVRDPEQPSNEAARLNATIITTVIEANLHPPKTVQPMGIYRTKIW